MNVRRVGIGARIVGHGNDRYCCELEPYQAFYDIYNKGQDNLIEIEMNTNTQEGRVRNLQHFGNEDWHYWDSHLRDTVPPTMP